MTITQKVKKAIKISGMTQRKLASELGIAEATLSRKIAVGNFSVRELEDLAELLGGEFVCYFEFKSDTLRTL